MWLDWKAQLRYCHGVRASEPLERVQQFLFHKEDILARCADEFDYNSANRIIEKLLNILGYDKKFYSEQFWVRIEDAIATNQRAFYSTK